jgi:hypothetical protein
VSAPLEAFDAAGRELGRQVRRDNAEPPVVHEHTSYCVIVLPPDEALPHARRYARPHHLGRRSQLSGACTTTFLDEAFIFGHHDEAGAALVTLRAQSTIFKGARVAFVLLEVSR